MGANRTRCLTSWFRSRRCRRARREPPPVSQDGVDLAHEGASVVDRGADLGRTIGLVPARTAVGKHLKDRFADAVRVLKSGLAKTEESDGLGGTVDRDGNPPPRVRRLRPTRVRYGHRVEIGAAVNLKNRIARHGGGCPVVQGAARRFANAVLGAVALRRSPARRALLRAVGRHKAAAVLRRQHRAAVLANGGVLAELLKLLPLLLDLLRFAVLTDQRAVDGLAVLEALVAGVVRLPARHLIPGVLVRDVEAVFVIFGCHAVRRAINHRGSRGL